MACNTSTTYQLSAADVTWGRRQSSCVTVNSGAATQDGTYFTLSAPTAPGSTTLTDYYVWFDLDDGSTDPAVSGATGIEVDIVTGDTAAQIATKLTTAVDAISLLRAAETETAAQVHIEAEFIGAATALADGDTSFVIEAGSTGLGGDLGKTSGGVTVSMEVSSVQITTDQTGAIPVDEVNTGQTISVEMSLLEMTPERWETVVGSVIGDTYLPSGGSQVVGVGTSRVYSSFFDLGGELVLHPTRFESTDRTRDITIPKCAPIPASINFSGEDPQVMEISFRALVKGDYAEAVNLMIFGDGQQDFRA